jgi:polyhydroxybutyrate depolymerase
MLVVLAAGCGGHGHMDGAASSSEAAVPDDRSSQCDSGGRLVEAHLAWDRARPFLLSTPHAGGRGKPLVVALHGSGGTPVEMEAATHLAARGRDAGVSIVLPSAFDEIWHNFSTADKPYLDAVIHLALRRTCADGHAIVLVGFSNGGDEAQTMGCLEAKRWQAVVVVSSSTVPDFCQPGGAPVTLLRVHGLDDHVSPFTGRTGADPRDPVLPATARWASYNGCRPRPVVTGTTRRWRGCAAGTSVALMALPRHGHSWPTAPDLTGLVLDLANTRNAVAPG